MKDFLAFLKGKKTYGLAASMALVGLYLLFQDDIEHWIGVVGLGGAGLAATLRSAVAALQSEILKALQEKPESKPDEPINNLWSGE